MIDTYAEAWAQTNYILKREQKSIRVLQYFCSEHGNIGSWASRFCSGKCIQHYCPYCLQGLAIEHPDMNISERVKLLDPVYPWTDELTKEDFEES